MTAVAYRYLDGDAPEQYGCADLTIHLVAEPGVSNAQRSAHRYERIL
jgi:hypothetical protein